MVYYVIKKNNSQCSGTVKKAVKGEIVNGMLNGESVKLFDNGRVASIINYHKNRMTGYYETFHSNGKIGETDQAFKNELVEIYSNHY